MESQYNTDGRAVALLLLAVLLYCCSLSLQAAEVPHLVHYEGYLTDSSGVAMPDSLHEIGFRIYDVKTDGTPLWTEIWDDSTSKIAVSKGQFRVLLGSHEPLPPSFFEKNPTTYLGITVGSDSEMLPRQRIASVPYAMSSYGSSFPSGGIIMWSGNIVDIPDGWALCDGHNGTPDLRDRFITGAGGSYSVGEKGGTNAVNLAHNHSISVANRAAFNTTTNGYHKHLLPMGFDHDSFYGNIDLLNSWGSTVTSADRLNEGSSRSTANTRNVYSQPTGSHYHSVPVHNHSASSAPSSGTGVDNRPLFYVIAFIMKL